MTLMHRAQHGVTEEIEIVAAKENVSMDLLRRRVASGRVVMPRNVNRDVEPCVIGEGLTVKINANVGTSRDQPDLGRSWRRPGWPCSTARTPSWTSAPAGTWTPSAGPY